MLSRLPGAWEIARRTEEYAKGMLVPGTLFEELGWNYIGPIDGHDLPTMVATLRNMRDLKGPQFLHVVTKKGKGFARPRPTPSATTPSPSWSRSTRRPRRKPPGPSTPTSSASGCATWRPRTRAWWASPRR